MNKRPSDHDYRNAHEVFSENHDILRTQFLERIANSPEPAEPAGPVQPHSRRVLRRSLVALAAAILLAVGVPFLLDGKQKAYGMEALLDRLLAVRSAEIRGYLRQEIVEQDGSKTQQQFPVRYFFERPGKLWMDQFGFSYPGDDEPTLIRHSIQAIDHDVLEVQSPDQGRKIASRIDPRLAELQVEQMIQGLLFEQLLDNPPEAFEKLRSEELNGVTCDVYSVTTGEMPILSKQLIWLNPRTGLPLQIAAYQVNASGDEQLAMMLNDITFDNAAPQDLFPLQPAKQNHGDALAQRTGIQAIGSATAGHVGIANWYSLQLNETTALCCWSQREEVDGETVWFNQQPNFKLISTDEVRDLRSRPIRDFESEGVRWRWSIVRSDKPFIGRTLQVSATQGRSTVSATLLPLRFRTSRLKEMFDVVQSLSGGDQEASAATLDSLLSSPD